MRWASPVPGLLHLPGRVPQRCAGSSIGPCPGVPCRASGAVGHTPTVSTAGTSGASHVLRRLSSCLPRPEDSGGPPLLAFSEGAWSLRERSNPRHPQSPCRSCTSTAGCAVTPAASRIRCRRFAHLVHREFPHDSAMDARRDTGGWLPLTRQGLSPCKRRQAYLGAITLDVHFVNPAPVFWCRQRVEWGHCRVMFGHLTLTIRIPTMPVPLAPQVTLAGEEQSHLESLIRAHSTPQALAFRCRVILRAAAPDRPSNLQVANELHCNRHTVGRWRSRYLQGGLCGLQDAPRPGRPRRFSPRRAAGGDGDGHP